VIYYMLALLFEAPSPLFTVYIALSHHFLVSWYWLFSLRKSSLIPASCLRF
jgi:hypothetical protein